MGQSEDDPWVVGQGEYQLCGKSGSPNVNSSLEKSSRHLEKGHCGLSHALI